MAAPDARSYRGLVDTHQVQFERSLERGIVSPYVLHIHLFTPACLLLYHLLPQHRFPIVRYLRFPIFACIVCFETWTIIQCRSMGLAIGYGVGLLSAWAIEWSAALLLFSDAQRDFRRIERATGQMKRQQMNGSASISQGSSTGTVASDQAKRRHAHDVGEKLEMNKVGDIQALGTQLSESYYWQSYPTESLSQRWGWVSDLVTNFRGIGWDWQISGLPKVPRHVHEQLTGTADSAPLETEIVTRGPTGNRRYLTREALLRQKLLTVGFGYMALDLLKVVLMRDPYFLGVLDGASPAYLPDTIRQSAILTKNYRLILSLLGVYTALQTIFALAPLFFVGILGPELIGARGEPWMYPDMYGEFRMVMDKGLAGWWGGWWHQIFRFAFAAPSKSIIGTFGMQPRGLPAKALQLVIAFALSGAIHACGSHTQYPPSRPLGPFMFFFLQAFGIIGQMAIETALKQSGVSSRTPRVVKRAANVVFVFTWLYITAPLLVEDFARGGLWLFEPVPISPLRGLGLGLKGEGWWCWRGRVVYWHWAERWWMSGLAF